MKGHVDLWLGCEVLLGLCCLWLIGLFIVLHSLQPMHHRMLYGNAVLPVKFTLKKTKKNYVNASKCAFGSV